MRSFLLSLLAGALAAFAQQKTTFEDRPALLLANDKLELTILINGGSLANLVLRDDAEKISPLWNPVRMAREAGEKPRFGASLGHFVCVDGFGPVSPEEKATGMPGHGEAHVVPWEPRFTEKQGKIAALTFTAQLPLVQEVFTRTLRMVDGENVIYVESQLESQVSFDRPVCWAEHATIGSPFLEPEVTVVDMSGKRAQTRPHTDNNAGMPYRLASGVDFTWPMAPAMKGGKIDVRSAPRNPNSIDHTTTLMEPAGKFAWVTAVNTSKHLMLGYVFKPQEYPWVQNWEDYPPNLKLARGLEFSTQPYDVPRREVIQKNSMFGAPVYRWLPAKARIESRFLLFFARVPEGFRKVDEVRLEGGKLVVEDRKARKQVTLEASLPL